MPTVGDPTKHERSRATSCWDEQVSKRATTMKPRAWACAYGFGVWNDVG